MTKSAMPAVVESSRPWSMAVNVHRRTIALTITTGAYPLVFIDQAERDLEFLGRGYPIVYETEISHGRVSWANTPDTFRKGAVGFHRLP